MEIEIGDVVEYNKEFCRVDAIEAGMVTISKGHYPGDTYRAAFVPYHRIRVIYKRHEVETFREPKSE